MLEYFTFWIWFKQFYIRSLSLFSRGKCVAWFYSENVFENVDISKICSSHSYLAICSYGSNNAECHQMQMKLSYSFFIFFCYPHYICFVIIYFHYLHAYIKHSKLNYYLSLWNQLQAGLLFFNYNICEW